MQLPETRYARSCGVNIAYQVMGAGTDHLILVPGWVSNIEEVWNIPQLAAWLRYLATIRKLVIFDKRGTGLSDRVNEQDLPDFGHRTMDLLAVMNAIGIKSAALLGLSEGGPLAIGFASQYPDRVSHLILIGAFARWIRSADYPYGLTREQHEQTKEHIFMHWGKPIGLHLMAPSVKDNPLAQQQWATLLRRSASPATARAFYEMNTEIDICHLLKDIGIPTLVMHRKEDRLIESGHANYLHENISASQLILSDGADHLPWFSVRKEELLALQTFLKGEKAIGDIRLDHLSVQDIFTLYEIRDHLLNHYEQDISIQSLSRHHGINSFKVKKGFKTLFGTPVIAFLNDIRLENARRLLVDPGSTIGSVAAAIGYRFANNFSVAFKRKYGMTPQEYKLRIAEGEQV